jgi:small subunit ribosomal protein S35
MYFIFLWKENRRIKLYHIICVLFALLFQKIEPWESEKSEADMEYYDWDASRSRKSVMGLLSWQPDQNAEESSIDDIQLDLKAYKEAVSNIMNEGIVEVQLH